MSAIPIGHLAFSFDASLSSNFLLFGIPEALLLSPGEMSFVRTQRDPLVGWMRGVYREDVAQSVPQLARHLVDKDVTIEKK